MTPRTDFTAQRHRMVEEQLERRGLRDPRVLAAMRAVPREAFVPPEMAADAYADGTLPIGPLVGEEGWEW